MLHLPDELCLHCRRELGVLGPRRLFEDDAVTARAPSSFLAGFCSSACYHSYGLSRYAVVAG